MQRNLVNKIFIYGLIVILFYASFSQNLHATDIGYKSIKQKDYQDILYDDKKKVNGRLFMVVELMDSDLDIVHLSLV